MSSFELASLANSGLVGLEELRRHYDRHRKQRLQMLCHAFSIAAAGIVSFSFLIGMCGGE